jgi:hypothetical protein
MLSLILASAILNAPVPAKPEQKLIDNRAYNGYFERNDSGLKGDDSQLVFSDADGMAKILNPPIGGKKSVLLTKEDFEKNLVAVVITRGSSVATYSDVSTTISGSTLTVHYNSALGAPSTANFATPLILSVPKDGIKTVVFIGNGKETAKIEVK